MLTPMVLRLPVPAAIFSANDAKLLTANLRWTALPELASLSQIVANGTSRARTPDAPIDTENFLAKLTQTITQGPQTLGIVIQNGDSVQRARLTTFAYSNRDLQNHVVVWLAMGAQTVDTLAAPEPSVAAALQRLGRAISDPWVYLGTDGVCKYLSPAAVDLIGPMAAPAVGTHFQQSLQDDGGDSETLAHIERALTGAQVTYERLRYDHRFGVHLWHRVSITPDRGDDGELKGVFLVSTNINSLRLAEESSKRLRAQLDLHARTGAVLSVEHGPDLKITGWSKQAELLFGYTAEEAIGKTARQLGTATDVDAVEHRLLELSRSSGAQVWRQRSANRTKSGNIVWIDWLDSAIRNDTDGGASVLCIGVDVTREVALQTQLAAIENHDALTGLMNRKGFTQTLDQHLTEKRPTALLLINLDTFKQINEYRGQPMGDLVLIAMAKRIKEMLQPGESVARVGIDEFVIQLSTTRAIAEPTPELRARRMLDAIKAPLQFATFSCTLTASAGLVVSALPADSAETLLRNANIAMRSAKARGKDHVEVFTDAIAQASLARLQTIDALRIALVTGAIEAHFQPVLSVSENRIIGGEALARWRGQDGAFVAPSLFIPLAEEAGLIHELWIGVMMQACGLAAKIHADSVLLRPIAVNVSCIQLRDPLFDQLVSAVLADHACKPEWITLEVTESAALGDSVPAATLHKLAEMGVRCSIDDFGTGYSNFAHLKNLPLSTLKIDRTFVRDLTTGGDSIVRSMIAMAHSLNLSVVAEGVEYMEELNTLREFGCDGYQGFVASAAIPADDFLAMLAYEN
jgi:diguanylate cyclase (GGDEF)-like protein/PAS domain S-box-containing protein